jgi:HD-GYP domain-containing protein (c-di-GMP phosphodiesterase class II)
VVGAVAKGPGAVHDLFASSCEVAGQLADCFAVPDGVRQGLAHVFARWDGRGWPPDAKGEAVSVPARIVHVAQDAAVFHRVGGTVAAAEVVRRRAGRAYDPAVADVFLAGADELLAATEQLSLWDAVLKAEPGRRHHLAGAEIDAALEAMGDFADLKSPWTAGHSRAVAGLVEGAARFEGIDPTDVTALRRAALVHDLGRVGVPNGVWEKASALTNAEWEQVRLHPYLTERILARSGALGPLGETASLHHERLDGSGYHRGAGARSLSRPARLLAAADAYQALTSDRPHRTAHLPTDAAARLDTEARAGRLDAEAVAAVVRAAGHAVSRRRGAGPAGLTGREVEVLRLLARGLTTKQVAASLTISDKTAGRHAENIYRKLGVGSRAAAALFAARHDLV